MYKKITVTLCIFALLSNTCDAFTGGGQVNTTTFNRSNNAYRHNWHNWHWHNWHWHWHNNGWHRSWNHGWNGGNRPPLRQGR